MECRFLLASLGAALLFMTGNVHGADNAQPATNQLIGSWKLASGTYNGKAVSFGDIVEIKHVTDSQFMWFRYKKEQKTVTDAGGGPYSVKADSYSEKIIYGLGKDYEVVRGQEVSFHWKVDGNRWRINGRLGNGMTIEEVWEKIGPEPFIH